MHSHSLSRSLGRLLLSLWPACRGVCVCVCACECRETGIICALCCSTTTCLRKCGETPWIHLICAMRGRALAVTLFDCTIRVECPIRLVAARPLPFPRLLCVSHAASSSSSSFRQQNVVVCEYFMDGFTTDKHCTKPDFGHRLLGHPFTININGINCSLRIVLCPTEPAFSAHPSGPSAMFDSIGNDFRR